MTSRNQLAPKLSEAQRAELKRRLASFERDKPHAVSWEAHKSELKKQKR